MKYCTNCGQSLPDDAVFCPMCGVSVQTEPSAPAEAPVKEEAPEITAEAPAAAADIPEAKPEKKRSKAGKKIGIAVAIVLGVLLAAAAVLYFTGLWKQLLPASRLKLGLAEKALVERGLDEAFDPKDAEVRSAFKDMKANVDVTCELEADGGFFSEITYIKMLVDELKLNINVDQSEAAQNMKLGLTYKGNPMLDATVLKDGEKLGIYVPQLDGNYYTLTLDKLKELAKDETDADLVSELDLTPFDEDKTRREVMELLMIVAKLSTKENTEISKGAEVSLFGMRTLTKTDKYTIKPTEEQIKAVIDEIADQLAKDGSYLGERLGGFYSAIANMSGSEMSQVYIDGEITQPEALPETLPEFIRTKSGEIAKSFAEKNGRIEIFMIGSDVVSHRFITDDGEYIVDHEEKGKVQHAFMAVRESEQRLSADLKLDRTDAAKTTIDYDIIDETGDTNVRISCVFDTTKRSAIGTCPGTVSVKANGNEMLGITVSEKGDGMEHVIKIDLSSSVFEGEDLELKGLKIVANVTEGEGVSAPAGVSPTDLSDKSAEEIGEIFENMLNELGSVLTDSILGGLF